MGILEFWQRQHLIDSGNLHPRILKPKKKKTGKNEISDQELEKLSPKVIKKIDDIVDIRGALVDAIRNLDSLFSEANKDRDTFSKDVNNKLWCVVYDINKFIEKKCKQLDKMKRQIADAELQNKDAEIQKGIPENHI